MSVVQHLGEKLEIKQAAPRFPALGLAMYYLCHRKPFSDMPTSVIIPVLDGQIRRGHALIAMQGPRAVGYFGWALFTIEEALTHVHTGEPPEGASRDHGDVLWPMTVAANSTQVLRALVRSARQMNVGRSIMTIRPLENGSRSCSTAPPSRPRTTPVRSRTTRTPYCSASMAAFSQSRHRSARNPSPCRERSVSRSSPRLSEQAFLDVDHIVGTYRFEELHVHLAHRAVRHASVNG